MKGARGFASAESLVGVALGFAAILAAFALARGVGRLGDAAISEADRGLDARFVLERIARDVARAGMGVRAGTTEEAIEAQGDGLLALRADLDRDRGVEALRPEDVLDPAGGFVPIANDEVLVYLRRTPRCRERALFEADLHADDQVVVASGESVARRDDAVEEIDAGPAAASDDTQPGTLYRVHFVNDARHFGTGRFRVAVPLVDGVTEFRVTGLDADGAELPFCGGAEDASARACRANVRAVRVQLAIATRHGLVRSERTIPIVRFEER